MAQTLLCLSALTLGVVSIPTPPPHYFVLSTTNVSDHVSDLWLTQPGAGHEDGAWPPTRRSIIDVSSATPCVSRAMYDSEDS